MNLHTRSVHLNNKTWHCVSVYYSKSQLHHLLSALHIFHNENQSLIKHLSFYYSDIQGEHLNIALIANQGFEEKIIHLTDEYFRFFLKESPSIDLSVSDPGKVIWINYPNNSLIWNNFNIPLPVVNDENYTRFSYYTSLLIMQLFDEDCSYTENRDTLISFFYIRLHKTLEKIDHPEMILTSEKTKYNKALFLTHMEEIETIDTYWSFEMPDSHSETWLKAWSECSEEIYVKYGSVQNMYHLIHIQWGSYHPVIHERIKRLLLVWNNHRHHYGTIN